MRRRKLHEINAAIKVGNSPKMARNPSPNGMRCKVAHVRKERKKEKIFDKFSVNFIRLKSQIKFAVKVS